MPILDKGHQLTSLLDDGHKMMAEPILPRTKCLAF
jgi:hypothetical protein